MKGADFIFPISRFFDIVIIIVISSCCSRITIIVYFLFYLLFHFNLVFFLLICHIFEMYPTDFNFGEHFKVV